MLLLRTNAMNATTKLLPLLLLLLLLLSQLNTVDGHVGKIDDNWRRDNVMVYVQVDVLLWMVVVVLMLMAGNGRRSRIADC